MTDPARKETNTVNTCSSQPRTFVARNTSEVILATQSRNLSRNSASAESVACRTRSRRSKRKRDLAENSSTNMEQQPDVMTVLTDSSPNTFRDPVEPEITRKRYQKVKQLKQTDPGTPCKLSKRASVVSSLKGDELDKPNPPIASCECGVCLEPVKERGLLDTCDHMFCFSCIMKWAKRSSSCPHCKRDVAVITKTDASGKILSRQHVKKRTLRDTLDREEFLQRSHHVPRGHFFRHNQSQSRNNYGIRRQQDINMELTHQLLTMHQMIRDNMTRMSTSLRGLQANLNNLAYLNVNGSMLPQHLNFCNFPTFAANINVTVNGAPIGQPANVAVSGFSVVDNSDYLPNPLFHYHVNGGDVRGLNHHLNFNTLTHLHQQMQTHAQRINQFSNLNFPAPSSFFPASGLFPQEVAQSLDMLARIGQTHFQQLAAMQTPQTQQPGTFSGSNTFPGSR